MEETEVQAGGRSLSAVYETLRRYCFAKRTYLQFALPVPEVKDEEALAVFNKKSQKLSWGSIKRSSLHRWPGSLLLKGNYELVEVAVRIAECLGRPIATADEARLIMGIKKR